MRKTNPTLRADDALAAWTAAHEQSSLSPQLTVECRLLTPMYGGGVTAGEVDCAMPIRSSSIRGQLRFWWRLLFGVGRDSSGVFKDEAKLWGGIGEQRPRASRVALNVEAEPIEQENQMVDAKSSDFPSYALIPGKTTPRILIAGYTFTLTLTLARTLTAPQREQLIKTLRWWASFGGVGARTRRGLGAVQVTGAGVEPVSRTEVEEQGGRMVFRTPSKSAIRAWNEAVDTLQEFRQGLGTGRQTGSRNRPGHSLWPEPDAIRRLQGSYAPGDELPQADGFFPRAAFGLPIVFRFKGRRGLGGTLNPSHVGRDRMASPLILRPYFDGQRYRPLALLLPGWEKSVSVDVAFDSTRIGPAWPEGPSARQRLAEQIAPMKGRGTDVLTAFLHYFEEEKR